MSSSGATLPPGFVETSIGSTFEDFAGVTFDEIGTVYAWDRGGRVWVIENDVKLPTPVVDISEEVGAYHDHGMLGFALDPHFRQNGYIYLLYTVDHYYLQNFGSPDYHSSSNDYFRATIGRLTRYTANASDNFQSVDPDSRTILLGETPSTGFPHIWQTHGVGSLVFGADGTLLVSCGDGAGLADGGSSPETWYVQGLSEGIIQPKENVGGFRAQMVDSLSGKILRLDPATGNGVPSNPFYDAANPRAARSRVWSLGLRNPCRMSFRPGTGSANPSDGNPGVLYIGDVGYYSWEELSVATGPGQNFGWPIFEGYDRTISYLAFDPTNQDAANPLFGTAGCTQQYFTFKDLLQEATLGTPSWPNPCNPAEQIPASIPRFVHTRPVMDWNHAGRPSRTGIFNGNDAGVIDIGAVGSPVSGPQFGGNASIGGTWYMGTNFPVQYSNTYFHADFGANWIHNVSFDSDNKPISVRDFATSAGSVVFMAVHPIDGSFYYIAWTDSLRKVSYVGAANQAPKAIASSDKTYGPGPLTVQFTGSDSLDPEGFPLTYRWDFGDGSFSTQANPTHVFLPVLPIPTRYDVTLTVTDAAGATNATKLLISANNTPPVVTILTPANGTLYSLSDASVFTLTATVTDAEQTLIDLSPQWQTFLHHNNHVHSDPIDTNWVSSALIAPLGCGVETYFYSVNLTVTDAAGLSSTATINLYPTCVNNDPPVVSGLGNQNILENATTGPLPFVVNDQQASAGNLMVTASSLTPALVPNGNVILGGGGNDRTVTVTPAHNRSGTAIIGVAVSDGALTTSNSFNVVVAPGPTYLLSEGFEAAPGFDAPGWIKHGNPNEDYTGVVLQGSQSLNCLGGNYLERSSQNVDSFYMYFRARWNTWSDYNNIVYWDDAAYGFVADLYSADNFLQIAHGAVFASGTTTIAENTTYHIWLEWTKGTGTNGTMKLFLSTDGIKPAIPEANITTGTGHATERMYFGPTGPGPDVVFDRILMADTSIGSVTDGNQAPNISDIPDQSIAQNSSTGPVNFSIGDPETDASSLYLSATSSNPGLVPNSNIAFGGSASNRTISVTPVADQFGSATITVSVSDGSAYASDIFNVSVTNPNGDEAPTISNIGNQTTSEDTAVGPIAFTVADLDNAATGLTLSATSSNPALVPESSILFGGAGANRTLTLIPAANQSGTATVSVIVSDGALTASNTFNVTVTPVNDPPTISNISDRSIVQDTSSGPISFTVGDLETDPASLVVTGTSSNPTIVPNSAIVFAGTGPNRTVTVTPAAGQAGSAIIGVTVSDGSLSATDLFVLTVRSTATVTYLLNEDFEAAGFDNPGWSKYGTPNEDYTGAVLHGSQALYCSGSQGISRSFDFSDQFYLYFRVRWNTWSDFNNLIFWYGDSFQLTAQVTLDPFSGLLSLRHGSAFVSSTTPLSLNTTYHMWIEWTKGSGTDGTMKLFVSTDGQKPAAPDATLSNGNGTAVTSINIGPTTPGQTVIFDRLLVNNTSIGSSLPPNASDIPDQIIGQDSSTSPLPFIVDEPETDPATLELSGVSSNPILVPNANIVFGGSGSNRTVTVTPASGQFGNATISVLTSDGSLSIAKSFALTVKPKLIVTAENKNRSYGAGNPALTGTITGLQAGDDITANYVTTASAASAPGSYPITITLNDPGNKLGNYTVVTNEGTLTVTKAPLSVTANGLARVYDGGAFSGGSGATYNGFVNDETESVLSGTLTYGGTSQRAINAGSYTIIPSGLSSANYDISFATGTLTISKAALTVSANNASKLYDGVAFNGGNGVAYTGFVNGETESVLSGTLSYAGTSQGAINAGSYTIIPSGLSSANYDISYVNGTLRIDRAPLTVTAKDQSVIYSGVGFTGGNGVTYAGFVNGETESVLSGSVSYAGTSQGAINAGSYTIIPSGLSSANYDISYANGTLTITRAALLVKAVDASRLYGQTNPVFSATFEGLVNGEQTNVLGGTLVLSSSAETNSPVGSYPIEVAGVTSDNYDITFQNGTLTVTPYGLTVKAEDKQKVYGESDPAFTVTYTGFVNGDSGSVLGGTLAISREAGEAVGTYTITPSGLTSSNYTVSFATGTLTISKAPLAVMAADATRVYGDANPVFTGTISAVHNNDNITVTYATSADATSPVSNYPITPTVHDPDGKLTNYELVTSEGTLFVTKAPLAVVVDDATRLYGAADPLFTATITGLRNGDNITATYATVATAASPAAPYPITATLSDPQTKLGNYNVVLHDGTLTVTPAPLSITADNKTRSYGAANPPFTGLIDGTQNGDHLSLDFSTVAAAASAVGPYPIVPALVDPDSKAGNYVITRHDGTLTIGPAPLVGTADNKTRLYGDTNPVFTVTYTGFVNNEDSNIVTGTLIGLTPAQTNSPIGSYPVSVSGQSASNYAIAYVDGVLTVVGRQLTIMVDPKSRQYGFPNPEFTGTIGGLEPGDDITASYSSEATVTSWVGDYPISVSLADRGDRLRNYLVVTNGAFLSVTSAPLIVTVDNKTRVYGTTNPPLTGTIIGAQNGDDFTATYSTVATAASSVGNYAIRASLTDFDGALGNYDLSVNIGILTVSRAPLSITADDKARVYGASDPAFTGSISGALNGDTFGLSFNTTATVKSGVGNYPIVPALVDSTGRGGNYTVTAHNGSLTITPSTLTATADDKSRPYGATNPIFTVTYSGFLNGDLPTVLSGALVFTTTAETNSPVGPYPINASGQTASNYTILYIDGTLSITAGQLLVSSDNKSRSYGALNPLFTGTITGLQPGDGITATYATAATTATAVGEYPISINLIDPANKLVNYTVSTNLGFLTVTQAVLTVTAANASRIYGETNPVFTGSITGLQNGDSIAATYSTVATAGSPVGTYAITPSLIDVDGKLPNYATNRISGTLTVTRAPLTITADDVTRHYGSANPVFGGTIVGLRNGDNITATYNTVATSTSLPGSYSIVPRTIDPQGKLVNYSPTLNIGTLTIDPAGVTSVALLANQHARVVGTADPGTTFTIQASSDLVTWQDVGTVVADSSGAFEFEDADAGSVTVRFYRAMAH